MADVEPFGVTPQDLQGTSDRLAEVSSWVKGVVGSLEASLAGEGAPWGADAMGHQFADGPHGYLAQLNWVVDSINAKTDLLDFYADSLKRAAKTFEASDEV